MKKELLDLLYPPRCVLCDRVLERTDRGKGICPACAPSLPWIGKPYCLKCGKPMADERKEYCASCMRREHLYIQGRSVFRYEKQLRASVLRMKFHNRREYLDFFASAMYAYSREFLDKVQPRCVLTVPMHPAKVRERGFDQCLLLGEKLCSRSGLVLASDAIRRSRYTKPQKGLDPAQRRRNLEDAFTPGRTELLREPVLLLDDIYTTGVTVDTICSVLHKMNITQIYVLTLCMSAGGEQIGK